MNAAKSWQPSDAVGKGLLARHPLISYFLLAYGGAWLVWSVFVVSRDGAGLLPMESPFGFIEAIALGSLLGPTLAAFIMTGVTEGKAGIRCFPGRLVLWRVGLQG